MAHVTVISDHQYVQQIVSGHHHLTADESAAAGGGDAGVGPTELLLASLGACTAIALRKHAIQSEWSLGKITVGLRWTRDPANGEHIERRISCSKPLSAEQRARLLEIAAETPISRLIVRAVPLHSTLLD